MFLMFLKFYSYRHKTIRKSPIRFKSCTHGILYVSRTTDDCAKPYGPTKFLGLADIFKDESRSGISEHTCVRRGI